MIKDSLHTSARRKGNPAEKLNRLCGHEPEPAHCVQQWHGLLESICNSQISRRKNLELYFFVQISFYKYNNNNNNKLWLIIINNYINCHKRLEHLSFCGRSIWQRILKHRLAGHRHYWFGSWQRQVLGSCERGNEVSGFITCKFLDKRMNNLLFKDCMNHRTGFQVQFPCNWYT
jgi:hypothetical protein